MEWYDPLEEMKRPQRQMGRFFENFGLVPFDRDMASFRKPLADMQEKNNDIVVTFEIPGIKKEDIELNITEDGISVNVERKEQAIEKREGFFKAERSYKGFYRSLKLPAKVIPDNATASYKDGVLEIRIPKTEKAKKAKKIEIK